MGCTVLFNNICSFFEYYFHPTFESLYGEKKPIQQKVADEIGKKSPCTICLETFSKKKKDVYMAPCNHLFHERCIKTWMEDHSSCPMCRKNCEFERTREIWKAFFSSIEKEISFPEADEESVEEEPEKAGEQLAGAVLREQLQQTDQLTQDYLYALELQAQEDGQAE
jgi:hypothetical protein